MKLYGFVQGHRARRGYWVGISENEQGDKFSEYISDDTVQLNKNTRKKDKKYQALVTKLRTFIAMHELKDGNNLENNWYDYIEDESIRKKYYCPLFITEKEFACLWGYMRRITYVKYDTYGDINEELQFKKKKRSKK